MLIKSLAQDLGQALAEALHLVLLQLLVTVHQAGDEPRSDFNLLFHPVVCPAGETAMPFRAQHSAKGREGSPCAENRGASAGTGRDGTLSGIKLGQPRSAREERVLCSEVATQRHRKVSWSCEQEVTHRGRGREIARLLHQWLQGCSNWVTRRPSLTRNIHINIPRRKTVAGSLRGHLAQPIPGKSKEPYSNGWGSRVCSSPGI